MKEFNEVFDDLYHPNPNININASIYIKRYWQQEGIERLLYNLEEVDVYKRRKSVKALASFGLIALKPVSKNFLDTNNLIRRVSCLKVLVKIVSLSDLSHIPESLLLVIEDAMQDQNEQISLSLISILRNLDLFGLDYLKEICMEKNILRSKAAITAISEINEPEVKEFLKSIYLNNETDLFIKEAIKDCLI